jgi:hypothetical protein
MMRDRNISTRVADRSQGPWHSPEDIVLSQARSGCAWHSLDWDRADYLYADSASGKERTGAGG